MNREYGKLSFAVGRMHGYSEVGNFRFVGFTETHSAVVLMTQ
jgi:hypothetical protein